MQPEQLITSAVYCKLAFTVALAFTSPSSQNYSLERRTHLDPGLSLPLERHDPRAEYSRRFTAWRTKAAELEALEGRISIWRFVAFGAAILIAWVGFDTALFPGWLMVVPIGVFVFLLFKHDTVIRARKQAQRAAAFYDGGIARLEDRWHGSGHDGQRFRDDTHPYSADLDLFGKGSLFELLCRARTRGGEERLAEWLLGASSPEVVRARQEAVAELRPRLDLREDIALLGADVAPGLEPKALAEWSASAPLLRSAWLRVAAPLLALATAVGGLAWLFEIWGPLPFLIPALLETGVGLTFRKSVSAVIKAVERPARDLALLSELLARLERETFESATLRQLRATLDVDGEPPSKQIARLKRRIEWLDARRNELFAPIAALLLWGTQCALAIEAWRARHGAAVRHWLDAVAEFEALSSFAAHAYEHPGDPFAEILTQAPLFDAEGLGHPLIPEDRCVRNDVHLDDRQRVLIISGSNMSGKSTLLRSVGINTVLALAGATVRAQRLTLSPLIVGASLRIVDSLQTGTSHFYAEIKRLRQLVDIAGGEPPLLFLLDEILHGTNSHDRRIGAEAVIRDLVRRGAIGLVTTHDLALARIADGGEAHAVNVHFEDHLEDGKMIFDYKMRPGVVTKSNALALMRSVGLEVN